MDTSPTVYSSSLPPSPNLIVEDSHDVITDIQDLDFDYYQDDTTLLDEGNSRNNDIFYDDDLDHPRSLSPPSHPQSTSPEFIENVDNAPMNPSADNPVPPTMNHAGSGADDEDLLQELIPAFQQTPPVRLLYLQAAIAHIIGSSTVTKATNQIQDGLDLIELCGALLTFPIPRCSIITVKKHLGLQTDDYVLRIPICDVCYKCYSLDDIQKLDTPICMVSCCKGNVYHAKHEHTDPATGEDQFKRIPVKVLIYCPIIKAVQRFLLRSTFVTNLRDTSQDINCTELSDDDLMHDIHDGTEWMKLEVGLKRVCLPDGSITDIKESPGSWHPLVCCDVGLSMTLNIDWFGITEGRPHSLGAVYISFNNLHQSVRYLMHNVHLALVIPGPKEPSLKNLNYCLEPLMDDIHCLYKGTFISPPDMIL
ncbi:uncharacterized protein BJ212DRAFT_1482550 [Suillus subaureus]|uniref:Uncharacterized protein n=1 Tax=Suillus subaureus TaxID=48587 RepID=A0A9P7E7R8_9AGAM|nr:uncharacterized protein BJ212DRAFT_1482550 [Suillus subaureus]KAG1813651.1 hypothetical protein BJ212DRAFT_1482550 [Suillus subaureus]